MTTKQRATPTPDQVAEWLVLEINRCLNARMPFTFWDLTTALRRHYPEFEIDHDVVKEIAMEAVEVLEAIGLLKAGYVRTDRYNARQYTPLLPDTFPAFAVIAA